MTDCSWAINIVTRAVYDWRLLILAKAWKGMSYRREVDGRLPSRNCNFDELRRFFTGDWCDFILSASEVGYTGKDILKRLEKELEEAVEADGLITRRMQ